jgi:hypothetical protein
VSNGACNYFVLRVPLLQENGSRGVMERATNQRKLRHSDRDAELHGALLPRRSRLAQGERARPQVPDDRRAGAESSPARPRRGSSRPFGPGGVSRTVGSGRAPTLRPPRIAGRHAERPSTRPRDAFDRQPTGRTLGDHGRSQGKRGAPKVGPMYPPATGRHEWPEADRSASISFVRGRPSHPHRSHLARKLSGGSRGSPVSKWRATTLTTRTDFGPGRGSPGMYTASADRFPRYF